MRIKREFYVFALLVFAVSCKNKTENSETEEAIPVKVETVTLSQTTGDHNYVGTIEENTGTSLSFPLMGTVEKVMVSAGQSVSKGQLLAVLNQATPKNTYSMALSSLKQAEDAYNRLTQLHDKGTLPEIKYIEVQTALQQAQAAESIARKNLNDCNLYAPFSGFIARKSIEPGMNVAPGLEVVKLVTIDKVNVKVSIPENEISGVKSGTAAIVNVAALNHRQFEGKVEEKGVMANPFSHTYEVKIRINNPQRELMPGMVCEVYIASEKNSGKILLPNGAVQILENGNRFVWLAKDGKATRKMVTTGALTNKGVVINTGLSAGDKVITEGNQKVSEGMKVVIK